MLLRAGYLVYCSSRLISRYSYSSKRSISSRLMEFKRIGTHSGTFHCDEALGCFMLKILNKDAEIVRSRDEKVLQTCDIVIDVGGIYDPSKHRYDHHQKEFDHTMKSLKPELPYEIKLSSAGLVYCHFGKEILKKITEIDDDALEVIYKKVYENFVMEVDGVDNGIEMFDGEPKYRIKTGLSSRVGQLNKRWNQKEFDENAAFLKAVSLAGAEFRSYVDYSVNVWWPARSMVVDALNSRHSVHENGQFIKFEEFVPWIEHLFELEETMKIDPSIKFVLYLDNGMWRIRSVPVSLSSYILRVPLFKDWRGLRDDVLGNASVPGITFVHNTGFIGGNKTLEGAIQMGLKSLDANPDGQ